MNRIEFVFLMRRLGLRRNTMINNAANQVICQNKYFPKGWQGIKIWSLSENIHIKNIPRIKIYVSEKKSEGVKHFTLKYFLHKHTGDIFHRVTFFQTAFVLGISNMCTFFLRGYFYSKVGHFPIGHFPVHPGNFMIFFPSENMNETWSKINQT